MADEKQAKERVQRSLIRPYTVIFEDSFGNRRPLKFIKIRNIKYIFIQEARNVVLKEVIQ